MKLNYLKTEAVAQLKENCLENIEYYKEGKNWVGNYLSPYFEDNQWFLESRISYQKADLILPSGNSREASKTDIENAKRIHSSLKNLTLTQAMDARIWTFLTHAVYQEYMNARWITSSNNVTKGTLERYFANTNREIIRNGIARLWWYGYLTYDESRKDPYELTDVLLSKQDIAQGLLERNLGNNKKWLINVLETIKEYQEIYPDLTNKKNMQSLSKYFDFRGGVAVLDCIDKSGTKNLIDQWILKQELQKREVLTV